MSLGGAGRAHISFRVGTELWIEESGFEQLLGRMQSLPGLTDAVMLFSSITHGPIFLDELSRRMAIAAERMRRLRQCGYQAGVNVLATIGHHEEALSSTIGPEYRYSTDIDGRICRGSFCPNSAPLHDYIREQYRIVCSAKPDFIWVDDDVRLMGHIPIRAVCFCDACLELFSSTYGTRYNRKTLQAAFDSGSMVERLKVRTAWLSHNRRSIRGIFGIVEETVHEAIPALPLGFMTGERFFEGYDFAEWAGTLAGQESADVYWRPGGGFYADWTPRELMLKSHEIGRQSSTLPPGVENIQSEIENFPYQPLRKSAHITVTEAAAHIGAGCTGAAFNVLPFAADELDEFIPILERIHAYRPFFDLLADRLGREAVAGACAGWNRDSMAAGNIQGGRWLEAGYGDFSATFPAEIYEIGIPPAYSMETADVVMLKGDTVCAFSEEELKSIFSGAVYMDGKSHAHLCRMGMSALTGFETGRTFERDCIELFEAHELNREIQGRRRDARQSFWHESAVELIPASGNAEILSSIVNYEEERIAPACMGVFENALGGRICVSGYAPWSFLQSGSKSSQMKSVFRWLTRDGLLAHVSSYHKICIWVRRTVDHSIGIVVLNASHDAATSVRLNVLATGTEARLTHVDLAEQTVMPIGKDSGYTVFEIPRLEPWQICLFEA